uniref:Large ribosomal subunit protein bL33c n=1 Tax=Pleonosporium borreri TaxID=2575635 RepID=A0A4D6WZ20_9FLOR|nr:ribosomal protein L33 [Pleonosporium borreri]
MGKNKGARIIITLECECRNNNKLNKRREGIFRYTSSKNRKNTPNRLEMKKFCPNCNQHVNFKEIK